MKEYTFERTPEIDYLNPDIIVKFEVDDAVIAWFPEVSEDDLLSKHERYVALVGESVIDKGEVIVRIRAVIEQEMNSNNRYYQEGKEAVENINIKAMKELVDDTCRNSEEYSKCTLVGDLHTHPLLPSELGVCAAQPSEGDIQSIIAHYENGDFNASQAYIFGIAAPNSSGETVYYFFRMIKDSDGDYATKPLDE